MPSWQVCLGAFVFWLALCLLLWACCVVAGWADEDMEQYMREEEVLRWLKDMEQYVREREAEDGQ